MTAFVHRLYQSRRELLWLAFSGALIMSFVWRSTPQVLAQGPSPAGPAFTNSEPSYSSPIALTSDFSHVWVVSPDDDKVYVIRTSDNAVVTSFTVGDEPQSIALDPLQRHAFVANAADNSVTVIQMTGPGSGFVKTTLRTGAEPWNIVMSPDGNRVLVANSVQDTITVIQNTATAGTPSILGHVDMNGTACNNSADHHFQPRGMAITSDNSKLYVTRFLSHVRLSPGAVQGDDNGKEGVVCRFTLNTSGGTAATVLTSPTRINLASTDTGFTVPNTITPTQAYPNQMQSIVLRGNRAFLPSIAASPSGPLRFNLDTHAYVNIIGGATGASQTDLGALNLHLGARVPESGKTRLFFANAWAMAFTNQSGVGNAYVVSAASDLLVKLSVDASDNITFTNGVSTTRYIDLNDPANPTTSNRNAGKNPLGIVIKNDASPNKAYVMNNISRNVSVVDLSTDSVSAVVNLSNLPTPGSQDEQLQVGAEIFFSSRGRFDRPAGTTVSTNERLSSEGWQACSSCHFNGWTDGEVWKFGAGPRKSVPLNATWSPHNPNDQRILNYSAIFDEVEDFEANIRNVSGPGPLATPVNGTANNVQQGLIISDTGDINTAPFVVNAFNKANAGRPQHTVTLPGSSTAWPALTAMKEWVRFAIRTPNGALTNAELTGSNILATDVALGRRLFFQSGCASCHGGTKWTVSTKDFVSPPNPANVFTEAGANVIAGTNPLTTVQFYSSTTNPLRDVDSFNLNVIGQGNVVVNPGIGAVEKATNGLDALGRDYNGDGNGNGFNTPSLLGIWHLPPYYHNGACETLKCVLAHTAHRTKGNAADPIGTNATNQNRVIAFLKTLDANTLFPVDLSIIAHDIFLDPPTVFQNTNIVVGANVKLFGTKADLADLIADFGAPKVRLTFVPPGGGSPISIDKNISAADFNFNFGHAVYTTTVAVPSNTGFGRVTVIVDPTNVLPNELGDSGANNLASRLVLVRPTPPDTTPPTVQSVFISDDTVFNDLDAIATTVNVKVKIVATDPTSPNPAPTTGVKDYCIVRYFYSAPLRRWVHNACNFQPLPAPSPADTFIVDATIPPFEGTAYAFVWVRDGDGNISRQPGFDVISFIPSGNINLNRNDTRLFRILLPANQQLTFTTTLTFGDVDLSAFSAITGTTPVRVALSAQNGLATESVTISNTTGTNRLFQIEVRAIANSRFQIQTSQASCPCRILSDADLARIAAPMKEDDGLGEPQVVGPPAIQTAIGDFDNNLFLPLVIR